MSITKSVSLKSYSLMKFFFRNIRIFFDIENLTLKVRILPFLTTFAQLSERLKNFLRAWLLVLGIKEGLVECATVCVKSVVILTSMCVPDFSATADRQHHQRSLKVNFQTAKP